MMIRLFHRRRRRARRPTLLTCPHHGDLYLVVPGVSRYDALSADSMTPLKADLAQPQVGERGFGRCPYGCGEPIRYGLVPQNVGRYA